jgi:hypothetical protein
MSDDLNISPELNLAIVESAHKVQSARKARRRANHQANKLAEAARQKRYRTSVKGRATADRARAKRSTDPVLRAKHNTQERARKALKRGYQRALAREFLALLPSTIATSLDQLARPPQRPSTTEVGLPTGNAPMPAPMMPMPVPEPYANNFVETELFIQTVSTPTLAPDDVDDIG